MIQLTEEWSCNQLRFLLSQENKTLSIEFVFTILFVEIYYLNLNRVYKNMNFLVYQSTIEWGSYDNTVAAQLKEECNVFPTV